MKTDHPKPNPFPKQISQALINLIAAWFEQRSSVGGRQWPEVRWQGILKGGCYRRIGDGVCLIPSTAPKDIQSTDEIGYLINKKGLLTAREIVALKAFCLFREDEWKTEEAKEFMMNFSGTQKESLAKNRFRKALLSCLLKLQIAAEIRGLTHWRKSF